MKVILNTETPYQAVWLREYIIKDLKGELNTEEIDTWSYTKSSEEYDIIFHNPVQYINEPAKNVIFKIEIDGSNVVFSVAWWSKNPEPLENMKNLHIGRLVEMLLCHYAEKFFKLSIVK